MGCCLLGHRLEPEIFVSVRSEGTQQPCFVEYGLVRIAYLLETIREFDPAIDAQTEAAWRDVMAIGIKSMIERY